MKLQIAVLLTFYLFIGIQFEERSLTQEFVDNCEAYRKYIRMFFYFLLKVMKKVLHYLTEKSTLGLSVTKAAEQLNASRPTLSRVLNGLAAISPEMALRIEGWLGVKNGGSANLPACT